jgi:hypothetical protein
MVALIIAKMFTAGERSVMTEDELIAKLADARRLAERFHLDFEEILDNALRKFPPDSIKAICARLKIPNRRLPALDSH